MIFDLRFSIPQGKGGSSEWELGSRGGVGLPIDDFPVSIFHFRISNPDGRSSDVSD